MPFRKDDYKTLILITITPAIVVGVTYFLTKFLMWLGVL